MNNIKTLLLLLLLTACNPDTFSIDPDDFGFAKFNVSSRGEIIYGEEANQVTSWTDSGLVIDGNRLVVMIRNGNNSRWAPWFGNASDLTDIPLLLRGSNPCQFQPNMCPNSNATQIPILVGRDSNGQLIVTGQNNVSATSSGTFLFTDSKSNQVNTANSACYFNKGIGLYGLISKQNPNINEAMIRNMPDDAVTFHLGESTPFIDQSTSAGGYNQNPPVSDGKLYFKILDNYYQDNGGQYQVVIKNGASISKVGPLATVISLIKTTFNDAVSSIYQNLIVKISPIVKICLTLYIILIGTSFAFGMSNFSQKELVIHLAKIAFIIQLITSNESWQFFNNTLFILFKDGVDQLSCIMVKGINGYACNAKNGSAGGLTYFDGIIMEFLSGETTAKILALLASQIPLGIVIAPILGGIIILFMVMVIQSLTIYLLSYIAISLLIILFPIFLTFKLFKLTEDLFNNWLKAAVTFTIQPLLTIAYLALIGQMILYNFHRILGYGISWQTIFTIPVINFSFSWWKINSFDNNLKNIIKMPIPETSLGANGSICNPYECYDNRYEALPYLKPADGLNLNDQLQIDNFARGEYVSFMSVMIFVVLVYLMWKFNKIIPDIANGLSDSVFNRSNLNAVAQEANSNIKDSAKYIVKKADQSLRSNSTKYDGLRKGVDRAVGTHKMMGGLIKDVIIDKLDIKEAIKEKIGINRADKFIARVQDITGKRVDSLNEIKDLVKDHAINKLSFGIAGKNMYDKNKSDEIRTRFDNVSERYNESFNVKEEQQNLIKDQLTGISQAIDQGSKYTAIALGASVLNPTIGAAIGAVGLYKASKKITNINKDIIDHSESES